ANAITLPKPSLLVVRHGAMNPNSLHPRESYSGWSPRRLVRDAARPQGHRPGGVTYPVATPPTPKFLVGERRLSAGPSTPFGRQAPANRPPLLQMLFLWTGFLLLPRSAWPRPLSVGRCPHTTTYKAKRQIDEAVPSARRQAIRNRVRRHCANNARSRIDRFGAWWPNGRGQRAKARQAWPVRETHCGAALMPRSQQSIRESASKKRAPSLT